ncbi:MAG: 1-acyl-sn-glycerol-3-phosphate acyltransferase [Cyanobium sp. MED843]|nr:1-acyl-sn-glycerol-3-phosphate acyltransferase [Cyanobium sp. MED843]
MNCPVRGALANRESALNVGIDRFWAPLAMLATQDIALRLQFRRSMVLNPEHLPHHGPVLLAPTHRARWDALLLPMAAGRRISGRDCRFMVTTTEMCGVQGWFLQRLGCFPVDQGRPSMTTLRLAIDLLADGQQLVVFPEGQIQRNDQPIQLRQGLVRLAQLAQKRGVKVPVIPVGLGYGQAPPRPFSRAAVCFGEALHVPDQNSREAARIFNANLAEAMHTAEQAARAAVGRPLKCF